MIPFSGEINQNCNNSHNIGYLGHFKNFENNAKTSLHICFLTIPLNYLLRVVSSSDPICVINVKTLHDP